MVNEKDIEPRRKELINILLDYADDDDFEDYENYESAYKYYFRTFSDEQRLVFKCIYKTFSELHLEEIPLEGAFNAVIRHQYHLCKEDERETVEKIEKNAEDGIGSLYPLDITPELKNLGYISLIYNMDY